MENLNANTVAAGSTSHTSTPDDISHDTFDPTPVPYYNQETYVDDESARQSIASTGIGQADQGAHPSHYLNFTPIISDVATEPAQSLTSSLSHFIPFGGPSSSTNDTINVYPSHLDVESTALLPSSNLATPLYSDPTSPGSIGSDLAAGINFSTLEDPGIEPEQPFILERRSRPFEYCHVPPLNDGEHSILEGEEGEEELSSASSTSDEQFQESTSSIMGNLTASTSNGNDEGGHEVEPAAGEATHNRKCRGISSQDEAGRAAEVAGLLKSAKENGTEARKPALAKLEQNGKTSKCITCGKTGRRDRLVSHVMYKYFKLKTWVCPLCQKGYATRGILKQHLNPIKVTCLCETQITRSNWYEHAKKCKACSEVAGVPKIKLGRVVVVQPTVVQARPSVQDPSPNEIGREGPAYTPRGLRRRPTVGRNASKKRKSRELDGSSEDEFKAEGRKPKRVKRNRT